MAFKAGQIIQDETGARFYLVPVGKKPTPPAFPSSFNGTQIRQLREKKEWSQSTLASKAEVTQATISNIETGKESAHQPTLKAIWKALISEEEI